MGSKKVRFGGLIDRTTSSVSDEALKILLQQSKRNVPLNLVIAAVIVLLIGLDVSPLKILAWILPFAAIIAMRFFHISLSLSEDRWQLNPARIIKIFTLGCALTGLAWSWGFVSLAPFIPEMDQIIFILALGGIAMGGYASMLTHSPSFLIFLLTIFLPVVSWLLVQKDLHHLTASIMILVFIVSTILSYFHSHSMAKQNIALRGEKEDLLESVVKVNEKLEAANKKIRHLARTDQLTRIANRLAFEERLILEWNRACRSNSEVSLLIVDIDHFKLYNDFYGHVKGDQCLFKVAQIIKKTAGRVTDLASRYGGEEFALLIPETSLESAILLGHKLLDAVKAAAIPHKKSTVSPFVTVSIGVASRVAEKKGVHRELVKAADKKLYKAKAAGRNCLKS